MSKSVEESLDSCWQRRGEGASGTKNSFSRVLETDHSGLLRNQNRTVQSCYREKHWHPVGLDFIKVYRDLGLPPLGFQLYLYMLIRSSPVDSPRVKNAHLFGDTIQKGEFFENKEVVANFFGKGELEEKAKINWFIRTVKPLVQLGLVKKIESGKRGFNATYIVYDVRVMASF